MSELPHLIVVKTGALGDLLISTPALWELHSCKDFESISLLGPPLWKEILIPSLWPNLRHLWIWNQAENEAELFVAQGENWISKGEFQSQRKIFSRYGAVANLRYESFRFAWAPWFARVPLRIGTCVNWASFLYTHHAPWLGQAPMMHERERNFQVISAYPAASNWASKWQARGLPNLKTLNTRTLQKWNLTEGQYVLINPTASQRFKAWPSAQYRQVIQKLRGQGHNVRIVGTLAESDWLAEVDPETKNWIQPETITELMDVVAGAKQLLANASSMHFLAASFDVPALVLMGAAHPDVWALVGPQSRYLKGKVPAGVEDPAERERQAFATLSVEQILLELNLGPQDDLKRG